MKTILFAFFYCVSICLMQDLHAQTNDKIGLYIKQAEFDAALKTIAQKNAESPYTVELGLFLDSECNRPIPTTAAVTVSVEPLIPAGEHVDEPLSTVNPGKVADARQGCTASYNAEKRKLIITLIRPYVFQDMRPGMSSRTWKYRINAVMTQSVSATAGSSGIDNSGGYECTSFFRIVSQKDGEVWPAEKGDGYTYTQETDPKEWQDLGTFDPAGIYSYAHQAVFHWKRGTEGKTLSVRWKIAGDGTNTFEDQYSKWQEEKNPCTTSEKSKIPPSASPTVSPVPTTIATVTPIPIRTPMPVTTPTPKVESSRPYTNNSSPQVDGKDFTRWPTLEVDTHTEDAYDANVREHPSLVGEPLDVIHQGDVVEQTGRVESDGSRNWVPIKYTKPDGTVIHGYMSEKVLKEHKSRSRENHY